MDREVTLDELLDEPIVRLLMHRDGVEAHEIRLLAKTLRRRIAADRDHPLRDIVTLPALDLRRR
jgi:hypothetical protein